MKQVFGWFEQWQPSGKLAEGGIELQPRDQAKTVRAGANGDIDDAVQVAATWPLAPGMSAVEIRPMLSRE